MSLHTIRLLVNDVEEKQIEELFSLLDKEQPGYVDYVSKEGILFTCMMNGVRERTKLMERILRAVA